MARSDNTVIKNLDHQITEPSTPTSRAHRSKQTNAIAEKLNPSSESTNEAINIAELDTGLIINLKKKG